MSAIMNGVKIEQDVEGSKEEDNTEEPDHERIVKSRSKGADKCNLGFNVLGSTFRVLRFRAGRQKIVILTAEDTLLIIYIS